MRYRGIHYDAGCHFVPEHSTRENLDPALLRYELRAIRQDLHANAVRVIGDDPARLVLALQVATELGLAVFLNPFPSDRSLPEFLKFLRLLAAAAEKARMRGADVTIVVGCEATLFAAGLLPGRTVYERVPVLSDMLGVGDIGGLRKQALMERLATYLQEVTAEARSSFGGPITYAAGPWEDVDWSLFDVVGIDHYRSSETAAEYVGVLRQRQTYGKPVAVLEVGCCTYRGAAQAGGAGWMLLDEWRDGSPAWVEGRPPQRSEATQARYLETQLKLISDANVLGAFVFTFTAPYLPHNADNAMRDFDRASYSLTKLDSSQETAVPPWQPKASFHAVAKIYEGYAEGDDG